MIEDDGGIWIIHSHAQTFVYESGARCSASSAYPNKAKPQPCRFRTRPGSSAELELAGEAQGEWEIAVLNLNYIQSFDPSRTPYRVSDRVSDIVYQLRQRLL